jgi:DnaJ-domain-containing protein 1
VPAKYYLKESDKQTGPFTSAELEERYRIQEIGGATPARTDILFCEQWEPLRNFFPHFLSQRTVKEGADQQREHLSQQSPEQDRKEQEGHRGGARHAEEVRISCVECGTALYLHLLETQFPCICPTCQTEYQRIQAAEEPWVFLILPSSRQPTPSPRRQQKRKRSLTPETLDALLLLELGNDATLKDVRRAYVEKVKQYHPDKVGHLGKEFQNIAEVKTAELNTAYRDLTRLYSDW